MGKCISGLSRDPICPYGDLGVEQVVPLVGWVKEIPGSCCAAHHPCCTAHYPCCAAHHPCCTLHAQRTDHLVIRFEPTHRPCPSSINTPCNPQGSPQTVHFVPLPSLRRCLLKYLLAILAQLKLSLLRILTLLIL